MADHIIYSRCCRPHGCWQSPVIGVTGATGAQGAQGPVGPAGPQGMAGPMGPQGIQGPTGMQGLQGVQGIQGITGPPGAAGATGAQGEPGPQGLQGATGAMGATGAAGATGAQGIQGATGPQGAAGATGEHGATGPAGPAGALPTQMINGNASAPGSFVELLVGDVYYRVQYALPTALDVFIRPAGGAVLLDLKRSSQFDGIGVDGYSFYDNYTLNGTLEIDSIFYSSSREWNVVWLRQRSPGTELWSLDEIHVFASNGGGRVCIWANRIFSGLVLD